jgi:predicted Ser/Thr protein kinase
MATRSLVTKQLASPLDQDEPISSSGQRLALEARTPTSPLGDDYIGRIIDGRYVVEALIGAGGMGVIYQCRHRIIGKKLAIKIIRREAQSPEAPQRFLIEARAASAIGSEHIIHISDFGRLPDGAAYLVMEFLEGTALSDAIESGAPLPIPRVLSIGIQLAEGLRAAHQAGIVHRDLKPENIFLIKRHDDSDFVKILDFGVAQMSLDGQNKLTRAGCIVGTPHYMSPEQAGAERVDQRGDIYSLGVILYELICGCVPFDGDNYRVILSQHLLDDPAPFGSIAPWLEVPPLLEQIVRRCMAKQPSDRYPSMVELCAELRRCEASLATGDRKSFGDDSTLAPIETGARAIARMSRATLVDGSPHARRYAAGALLVLLASFGGWLAARVPDDAAIGSTPVRPATAIASNPPTTAPWPAAPAASEASSPPMGHAADALGSARGAASDSAANALGDAPNADIGSAKAAGAAVKARRTPARKKPRASRQSAHRTKPRSDLVQPWAPKR